MTGRITIMVPTEREAVRIRQLLPGNETVICGVGMVAAAAAVAAMPADRDGMLILAGIAGSYGNRGKGESVLVGRERIADLGVLRDGALRNIFPGSYDCPYTDGIRSFPIATSNSVNLCGAPYTGRDADIENMEGAAFFALCTAMGKPFLELRCVSNTVGESRERWNVELAVENLARDLKILTDEINA